MPSQQSSLSGMRTALACQEVMAATDAWSEGPSKNPYPWIQAYSVPERSTPRSCTGWPDPFTSWLPATRIDRGAAALAGTEVATKAATITEDANAAAKLPATSCEPRHKRRAPGGLGAAAPLHRSGQGSDSGLRNDTDSRSQPPGA